MKMNMVPSAIFENENATNLNEFIHSTTHEIDRAARGRASTNSDHNSAQGASLTC